MAIFVFLLLAAQARAQQPIDEIEVVARTPLGAGVNADLVASNVHKATAEQIRDQRAVDLADFMKRNLASVFVNEAQSNPLQPDVQYRGFVASPLLGLPQGVAVYQDGVRINEPFGDTVNWALIPDNAIETVYLMPGSNPLFGLNALGGAIAIETKNGFLNPGNSAEIYGGSFGRWGLSAETGGSINERFSHYLTGSYFTENGWRDFSPTDAIQLFGKLAWQNDATSVDLSMSLADTDLIGNGAAPIDLLDSSRTAVFTRPDQTENDLKLISLLAKHEICDELTLTGNAYFRKSDIASYNGDDSDYAECEIDPGFVCEEHGDNEDVIFDQIGDQITASAAVLGATVNRSNTEQDSIGLNLQMNWSGNFGSHGNSFMIGLAYDESNVEFGASTELGVLDETRLAVPSGIFVGDSFTALVAETSNLGFYVTNTFLLSDRMALTLSGRYTDTRIRLRDQLGTELNGDHSFNRFNPAIGITVALSDELNLYAGYSESNRAPSPVELTCADENDPCRLPNAFLADPPLEQVVAKTFELGARGKWNGGRWQTGLFQTTNNDDIHFVSAGALSNQGFFDNIGKTHRIGLEINLDRESDIVSWFANYTYLAASFEETLALPSANNPTAVDGEVFVTPGNRLPLIPRSLFKAGLRISVGTAIKLGGEVLAGTDFHMRGDEGNDSARIGGHAVLNLRGEYLINKNVGLFVNVDNVFNLEYETFGLFGAAEDVLGDDIEDSRFFSPAAPRAAWLGLRAEF